MKGTEVNWITAIDCSEIDAANAFTYLVIETNQYFSMNFLDNIIVCSLHM